MNELLVKYVKRFKKEKGFEYERFFTQYSLDEYQNNLPYIFGVESFCLKLYQALTNKEKICIYSDYDTDAVTATAVMYWGLIDLGFKPQNLDFYVPDRFTEGYGMNSNAVSELAQKYDLIISVDCGINSVAEAQNVKSFQDTKIINGARAGDHCDLIITDHHHLQDEIPDCLAVLNPRLAEYYTDNPGKLETLNIQLKALLDNFISKFDPVVANHLQTWVQQMRSQNRDFKSQPRKYLSSSVTGVGVAWFSILWLGYFLADVAENQDLKNLKNLNKLLPLVAIGTVADCQSIIEPTNRLLVKAGLKMINDKVKTIPGLELMLEYLGFMDKIANGYKLTSQDLGFVLSPILNSSGRLSHAKLSILVLLGAGDEENKKIISELVQTNEDRKQMVKSILGEIEDTAKTQAQTGEPVLWLEGNWSKGIVGLLASRLVNTHNLPVVVISKDPDDSDLSVSASLRAPEGYHLPKALDIVRPLLLKGGGHPGAAGFSATPENLAQIRTDFIKAIVAQKNNLFEQKEAYFSVSTDLPNELRPLVYKKNLIWLEEKLPDLNLLKQIMSLDPFGQDFLMPALIIKLSFENLNYRWLGQEQKHLKINLQNRLTITVFNISNNFKNSLTDLNQLQNTNFWMELKVTQNTWNGKTSLELISQNIWI